jgi:hypothetical protein
MPLPFQGQRHDGMTGVSMSVADEMSLGFRLLLYKIRSLIAQVLFIGITEEIVDVTAAVSMVVSLTQLITQSVN